MKFIVEITESNYGSYKITCGSYSVAVASWAEEIARTLKDWGEENCFVQLIPNYKNTCVIATEGKTIKFKLVSRD